MKNTVLTALAALAFVPVANASIITKSATVTLSEAAGGYPYVLQRGSELAGGHASYIYKGRRVEFDIGGYFEDPKMLCFTFHQTPDTTYGIRSLYLNAQTSDGNYYWREGLSNYEEGVEECMTYTMNRDDASGFDHWAMDIYTGSTASTPDTIQLDNLTISIKGFGWVSTEDPIAPPSSCADGLVYVDAVEHSVSPLSVNGDYLTCQLDPNVTYELKVESQLSQAIHDNSQMKTFGNVGVTFNDEHGQRFIYMVEEGKKTYVTTDGEVSFFYADANFNNEGGASVSFKRTNLD